MVILATAGMVLWLINFSITMDERINTILNIAVVIVVVLYILGNFAFIGEPVKYE